MENNTEKKMTLLAAAANVLSEAKEPMNCKQIIERVIKQGLWESTGKTPENTLYTGMLNDIRKKQNDAQFKKVGRGQFSVA